MNLDDYKDHILNETKSYSSFVNIGETLHNLYYKEKLVKNQKEFLDWTKRNLGFSKSTTYEYIISYKIYSEIVSKVPQGVKPPMYQSHCQLLAKVPNDQLVLTWVDATAEAPNGIITTSFLENFLVERNLKTRTPQKEKRRLSSPLSKAKKKLPKKKRDISSESEDELSPYFSDTPPPKSSKQPDIEQPPQTPPSYQPDVLAAAAVMELLERTPPNKQRLANVYRELVNEQDDDISQLNILSHAFDSPIRTNPLELSTHISSSNQPDIEFTATQKGPETVFGSKLPFNEHLVYEIGKSLSFETSFDFTAQKVDDFLAIEHQQWYGRIFCNLCEFLPFSTSKIGTSLFYGGIERILQIIFTKFANKEFTEGIFIVKGEFGADWFTPILQNPYVILRHFSNTIDESFHSYVAFYLGSQQKEFCNAFQSLGIIPGQNSWAIFNENIELIQETNQENALPQADLNIAASALCKMTTILDEQEH